MTTATPMLAGTVELGPRPYYLIDRMANGPLKEKLLSCGGMDFQPSTFSIGHRGAPLQFAEHTNPSYRAAARMGAGIVECDVTFTKDKRLVCRHSQNDLHTTTNILATALADKCTAGFSPAEGGGKATAECRTSDITLTEFETLQGKMDGANPAATNVAEYLDGTKGWRTDLYAGEGGAVVSHAQYIAMMKPLGVKFTPELKSPAVKMPFNGFTQQDFAQAMIDEYKSAGVAPGDVYPQSFDLGDILYWIRNEPEFGKQAVYLDASYRRDGFDPMDPSTFKPSMAELADLGVNYIAPPMWVLVTLENGKIVPSAYARTAKAAGLNVITWTLERSGPLRAGGGWYYRSITDVVKGDGQMYELLDVLAQDVGVKGIFSDWPATVTYYANCMQIGNPL
ncbi:MAG: glycerophosphodiester phosphodiesterase [Rhodobacteraceae bacterium]|nr:glycerophosphodiester phosphodiesterase [Paracoccaceae bacterium]